jgi:hypothetical protein
MATKQYKEVSFYIVAHADDWQLFMNPNVYRDLINGDNKVVIIITTAGDAGSNSKYWAAREEGCKSSVRFCVAPHSSITEWAGEREIRQHIIPYWCANNVSCYFFRLPDGNLDGRGFSNNHYQSLSRLKSLEIAALAALDGSPIYQGWKDFYSTLNGIIDFESKGLVQVRINYLNPDPQRNPGDHSDHIATGQAIQAMNILPGVQQVLYSGYGCNGAGPISTISLFWKVGMLAAYEKAVFDICGYSTLKEDVSQYIEWCFKNADLVTIEPQISVQRPIELLQ